MPGNLPDKTILALLEALPLDITFADSENLIRYYSPYRIFVRTPAILGTRVEECHKAENRARVCALIDGLRAGASHSPEFRVIKDGREVRIRYLALRNGAGEYLGVIEVGEWVET
jgi:uncharacterized protein